MSKLAIFERALAKRRFGECDSKGSASDPFWGGVEQIY